MTIEELNNNVQAFNLQNELDKIIIEVSPELVDANTEMLYSGIDAEGKSLGQYAPRTIEYKEKKGQPTDRITLKDTGEYYAGKEVVKTGDDYTIISTDPKNDKLVIDFGIEIDSIDKNRMGEITDDQLSPKLTDALQKVL